MPEFINVTFRKLNPPPPQHPQYSPHKHYTLVYTQKGEQKYALNQDKSLALSQKETKWIQQALGCLLWFERSLDYTMLPAVDQLSSQQSLPTEKTRKGVHQLLDYVYTHKNTTLWFHASNMLLTIDSDASSLCLPKAQSRLAGYS